MTGGRVNLLPWLLGALAFALMLALWIWFDRNFEKQTHEVETGWSAEARRNPFLAAERFLRRAGIEAQSRPGRDLLRQLPPPDDMLVINGLDAMTERRRARLRAWLEDGGHLLVEATRLWAPDETPRAEDFLAGFGALLRVGDGQENNGDCDGDNGNETCAIGDTGDVGSEVVAEIEFDGYPQPVQVGFIARYFLEDADGDAVDSVDAGGLPRLLQYRVGDGLLTVTSDNVFLTNADIGNHDHALALALLSDGADKVWLLYDHMTPGLATLLWRRAPQAVISAALLAAALLWHLGAQIGPRMPAPARARRNLTDHLEAAGALMWRHGRGGFQLAATRRRVEQAWLRRHPLLHQLDDSGRAGWISEQVGVDAAKVYDALYPGHQQDQDFRAQSRMLQRLWIAL